MMSDAAAQDLLRDAWRNVHGGEPPRVGLRMLQAIARFEGSYGTAFKDKNGKPVWNFGAIHRGFPDADGNCQDGDGLVLDSVPTQIVPDGAGKCPPGHIRIGTGCNKQYPVCMKGYGDCVLCGAEDLVRQLGPKQRPLSYKELLGGTPETLAKAMYREKYFGGGGQTEEARIGTYADEIRTNATIIAKNLGEADPLPPRRPGVGTAAAIIGAGVAVDLLLFVGLPALMIAIAKSKRR